MSEERIYDIHTHHEAPQPHGIINIRLNPLNIDSVETLLTQSVIADMEESIFPQLYSIGVHPWDVNDMPDENFWQKMRNLASLRNVVAIGETGVDIVKGASMFIQMLILKKHVEISEEIGKSLILHVVKADDMICALRRDLHPKMNWMVHGYRGKPQGAAQLVKAGCFISFGERFNPSTLMSIPKEKILAETDESPLSIEDIIVKLSEIRGMDLHPIIAGNSFKFLNFES